MSERAYLSIGEVLALLKDEFIDITISKIRFLESQGLIDPERTPSGYRKFYEPDVERLRWILRQQKEHYLPLRVIKGKLSEASSEDEAADEPAPGPPTLAAVPDPPDDVVAEHLDPVGPAAASANGAPPAVGGLVASIVRVEPDEPSRRAAPPFPESLRRSSRVTQAGSLSPADRPRHLRPHTEAPPDLDDPPPVSSPDEATGVEPPCPETTVSEPRGLPPRYEPDSEDEVELTAEELAGAAGLAPSAVADLERYGLIKGRPAPGGRYYDAAALEVAGLAAAFAHFGVEARHLRMWKTAADREADFYEQVVMPLRSQRSAKARRQAGDTVKELAGLGTRLHAALVAETMKRLT